MSEFDVFEARIAAIELRQLDLEAQRDKAREECGHEKAMRRSLHGELDRFIPYYRQVQAIKALIAEARKISPSGSMSIYCVDLERALGLTDQAAPRKAGHDG